MSVPNYAVITGASSGIGEVYADRLAARRHDLILVGRNQKGLHQTATRLVARDGIHCEVVAADLSQVDELWQVEDRLRRDANISMLVNCAGLVSAGPLADADPDKMGQMLEVNIIALSRLCAAAARNFGDVGRGGIVNVSSATAFFDEPRSGAYAASKAFVLHLSLALGLELAPNGVQVQVVLPGYTATPMLGENPAVPEDMLMSAATLVDAALAGFDRKEAVTIPSLEDMRLLNAWIEARKSLRPEISRRNAASRYGVLRA